MSAVDVSACSISRETLLSNISLIEFLVNTAFGTTHTAFGTSAFNSKIKNQMLNAHCQHMKSFHVHFQYVMEARRRIRDAGLPLCFESRHLPVE